MNIESIKIIAAIFGVVGSIILAYRVTGILSALTLVTGCHEENIQQLMPGQQGDIHNFANSTAHVAKGSEKLPSHCWFCILYNVRSTSVSSTLDCKYITSCSNGIETVGYRFAILTNHYLPLSKVLKVNACF